MTHSSDGFSAFRETAQLVGEVFGVLLTGVFIGAWGAIKNKKVSILWKRKQEQRQVETHSQLHEILTELRVTVRACRCLIFQFHNGGSFADGTSIKRFSVTHESCSVLSQTMILESQDVLVSRYSSLMETLEIQSGKIIAVNALTVSAFRSSLEINSVEYFSIVPLRCSDGISPLGFLMCHWCSSDSLDEIESEGINQASIEGIIVDTANRVNSHLIYKTGNH